MNSHLLAYRPRLKTQFRKGKKTKYWWVYYLPVSKAYIRFWRPIGNDKRLAESQGKLKEAQLVRGVFDDWDRKKMGVAPDIRLTIADGVERYLEIGMEHYSANGKKSVGPTIERLFRYFQEVCKKTYLDEITERDFTELKTHLKHKGFLRPVKKITLVRYQKWINTAFNWFVRQKYLEENPLKHIAIPKLSKSEKVRAKVIPPEHWKRILSAPEPEGFGFDIKKIVIFLTATGIRKGELFHLQWSDIDFSLDQIDIKSKPDCPTTSGLGWKPKSGVEGKIPLSPLAKSLLESLPTRGQSVFGRYKDGGDIKIMATDFVFARKKRDTYMRLDTVKRAWNKLLKNAGLQGQYTIKDLRSTANSYLKSFCGLTQDEACKVLRNSREVNQAHYSNTVESELKRKMADFPTDLTEVAESVMQNETVH